jgi:1,4-dihydroxy-2-naphthoate octaprenyltransferase
MAERGIFAGVPWWVQWVVVPVIALFVFGSLIFGILSFLVGLLFKVLIFVAVVGGLLYVIRKFMSSRSSGGDW